MAVLSKHEESNLRQSVEAWLRTKGYEITVTETGESCVRYKDTEEATNFQAQEASKNESDIIAIQEEEVASKTSSENDSPLSTPSTPQSKSDIFRLNRKKALHLGQKLIRRYKRLLRDASTLEEGKLQVRSKTFRFIRRNRRGRNAELKALISYSYKIMRLEFKPRGWIRRLLEEMLKLATKFGMSLTKPNHHNNFRLRAMASKLVGEIEKIEEIPGSAAQEEADKGFFNKNLGTWGIWSESEWEKVRDGRESRKTVK